MTIKVGRELVLHSTDCNQALLLDKVFSWYRTVRGSLDKKKEEMKAASAVVLLLVARCGPTLIRIYKIYSVGFLGVVFYSLR